MWSGIASFIMIWIEMTMDFRAFVHDKDIL